MSRTNAPFIAADVGGTHVRIGLVRASGDAAHPALMDADGAALVIHANPDDYRTQPIGGAGDRVACAVIR